MPLMEEAKCNTTSLPVATSPMPAMPVMTTMPVGPVPGVTGAKIIAAAGGAVVFLVCAPVMSYFGYQWIKAYREGLRGCDFLCKPLPSCLRSKIGNTDTTEDMTLVKHASIEETNV